LPENWGCEITNDFLIHEVGIILNLGKLRPKSFHFSLKLLNGFGVLHSLRQLLGTKLLIVLDPLDQQIIRHLLAFLRLFKFLLENFVVSAQLLEVGGKFV
jgi:hypothetical protein